MKTLKFYWFIGIICSICLISCSKYEDIFIGHGSIVYENTTYRLDYADVKKELDHYPYGENITYYLNLYSRNNKNKVNIFIRSKKDVTFSELSGQYQVMSISINTLNKTIQVNISLVDSDSDYYVDFDLYTELQKNNVYSLKLKSINDNNDFITWEGTFNFKQ
ncbi:MAG: hypothetical protein LBC68_03610 [Prevotellaceae bacterium]|jgi:hypothetical protein|nr:hypothetical protein [Prevotellaceae bacterium]